MVCRDVVPPLNAQTAGAATSATVPSANDLEDSMDVDSVQPPVAS
jgi:hypothetical protein